MPKKSSTVAFNSSSRLMNSFMLDFRNKSLFNRINAAKSKVDTRPMPNVKHNKCDNKTANGQETDKKDTDVARKLAEIYCHEQQQ